MTGRGATAGRRRSRILVVAALTLVALSIGDLGYVAYEGSLLLVSPDRSADCATPRALYGWAYEPINYDARADASGCVDLAIRPGAKLVASDGVRLAGWYIPAADGAGPDAPTIVLVHGHGSNKSTVLPYGVPLHGRFNLVAFDLRNAGQSAGEQTTMGVRERGDLRAVIDWLEREKRPMRIGVLGISLGAVTALLEAADDQRVDAVAVDSMYARLASSVSRRLETKWQPSIPGTWAVLTAARIRTGLDLGAADPVDAVAALGARPLLITHGSGDGLARPAVSAELVRAAAQAAGIPVTLRYCDRARHGQVAATCPAEWKQWVTDFFETALRRGAAVGGIT